MKSTYDLKYMGQDSFTNRAGGSDSAEREKHIWNRTWNLNIKRKLQHFIWKCINGSIPISDQLKKKGIEVDSICKLVGRTMRV